MPELPITARELAADIAFQEALQRYAHGNGPSETVAWCALRAIERAMQPAGVVGEIAAERRRQIEVEGWRPEDDDCRTKGELAAAAATYAQWAGRHAPVLIGDVRSGEGKPLSWPFSASWWKPKDRRRDLIRAAALLVAEIERLDRAAASAQAGAGASAAPAEAARPKAGSAAVSASTRE